MTFSRDSDLILLKLTDDEWNSRLTIWMQFKICAVIHMWKLEFSLSISRIHSLGFWRNLSKVLKTKSGLVLEQMTTALKVTIKLLKLYQSERKNNESSTLWNL